MTPARQLTLFDLDGTLIETDSDHAFGEFLVAAGWADREHFKRRNDDFYAEYLAGTLDVAAYVEFATAAWRSRPGDEAQALRERFVQEVMRPALTSDALALVRRHQAAGDRVAIVTATNEFVTEPIARVFGVNELIAVRLSRDAAGWFSGEIDGVPSLRAGKVTRVGEWLAAQGLAWDQVETTFYSDSPNDLPLLERCDHPVATNPDETLRRLAAERGWRILDLFASHP